MREEEGEQEKDELLEKFVAMGEILYKETTSRGYYCDFVDPSSGILMKSENANAFYPEMSGIEHFLRFKSMSNGQCVLLVHPLLGRACYPASLFTTAPEELIDEIFTSTEHFTFKKYPSS